MTDTDFSPEALRAALRQAERGIRLNWIVIAALAAVQALILGFAMKVADFGDDTHTLVVLGAAFVWVQVFFMLEILVRRQDAVNARILRALQLLDDRLARR